MPSRGFRWANLKILHPHSYTLKQRGVSYPNLVAANLAAANMQANGGSGGFTQHSTLNNQHSTLNTQHSTLNTQHSTLDTQHSTLNTQHSTSGA